jgi:hypothetical protein
MRWSEGQAHITDFTEVVINGVDVAVDWTVEIMAEIACLGDHYDWTNVRARIQDARHNRGHIWLKVEDMGDIMSAAVYDAIRERMIDDVDLIEELAESAGLSMGRAA